jgi:hypothetical protein
VPVLSPGDIVVRENPSQKVAGGRKAIAAAAAAPCFLPAYSPDRDPIDPTAGSGGLRQLSGGFSTKPRLRHFVAGERLATDKGQSSVYGAGKRSLQCRCPSLTGRGRTRKADYCLNMGQNRPAPTVDALKSAGCVVSPPNPALLCYLLT